MIEAMIFIPLVIIAITQAVKISLPVNGWATIAVAFAVGVIVSLVDVQIGVEDVTIAQGIVLALGAVGITTVASKIGGEITTATKLKK